MRDLIEGSPYARGLGVSLAAAGETSVRLHLPYREANSNPGGALHGGCAASLGLIGGQAVARLALGEQAGPFVTVSAHVSYLAAALGEDVVASAELARRGKELCFVQTTVETTEGKPVAHVTSVVRSRAGTASPALPEHPGDDGGSESGAMGAMIGTLPFIAARQLSVEQMSGGRARVAMPLGDANGAAPGTFHEGAVVALLDTTGGMAAWSDAGPGPAKASTAAIEVQILDVVQAERLVAYGRVAHRDHELYWVDVEVVEPTSRQLHARGTVIYRIVR